MYESPIKVIHDSMARQIQYDYENNILKAVASYNIDVNKEELIKALKYERDQYNKGYEDAKKDFAEKIDRIVERLEEVSYDSMHLDMSRPMTETWQIVDLDEAIEIVKGGE